jgi:hypothetical protein
MMIPEIVYEHYLKVPVIKRKHFTVWFEEHIFGTFIHCTVTKYSARIKQELQDTIGQVCRLHGGPIYVYHDLTNRRLEKFMKMFGFKY